MSTIGTYKNAQMERVFEKLQIEERRSHHHRSGFIINNAGRKLYPPIRFSKGKKDILSKVADKIRKSLYLDAVEFDTLLKCQLSRNDYLEIRKGKMGSE